VDVKESPKSYIFVADMPGLKSSDIKVLIPWQYYGRSIAARLST
jgi:HSP20 family molecular chaperone IbpA